MDANVISETDLESLQPERYLRGAVIDFYIQYLKGNLPIEDQRKCYFFNNWFFTKLCESCTINGGVVSYRDVQKWSKDVDLCEKSYVFIPVNKNSHWSLVIICDLNTSSPYGLHLDSKKGHHHNIQQHIINYFSQVWMTRNQTLEYQLRWIETEVPQQENQSDCGVYLLHYIERFLLQAFTSGNIPACITKDWFTSAEVASKRTDIINLVLNLSGRSEEPGAGPPGLAVDIMLHGTIAKFPRGHGHDQSEEFKQPQDPVGVDTHRQVAGPSRKRRRNQVNQGVPRRDRSSNWTNEETHVLLRCKREAVSAQGLSQRKSDRTAAWKMISEKIPGKSTLQCQRRWDTLKKSMRDIKKYCVEHNKEYGELQKTDVAKMELATAYDPGWYKYIDVFCNTSSERNSRSAAIENVTCIVEQEIHSTSPQRGSPHQQCLQNSMENPEEKLSMQPVTVPSGFVQKLQPQEQENTGFRISRYSFVCGDVSAAIEREGKRSLSPKNLTPSEVRNQELSLSSINWTSLVPSNQESQPQEQGNTRGWGPEVDLAIEMQGELSLPPKNLRPSELCMQGTNPRFQGGQEVVVSSSFGVSTASEREEQSLMRICLVPSFWLQTLPATFKALIMEHDSIRPYNLSFDLTTQMLLDILLFSPWSMELQTKSYVRIFNVSLKELSLWLAILYGMDVFNIMHSLQVFYQRETGYDGFLAPDDSLEGLQSCLEFAVNEVRETPEWHENRLVVFEEYQVLTDVCANMAHHEATEVVHLFSCRHLTKLNLRSFRNLRSLCVEYCYELREVSGWDNLGNLAWLRWCHSCIDSFPDTRHLTALEFLELDGDCAYTSTITSPPDLSQCHQLRSLTLKWYPMLAETPDMTNLKRLESLRINFCDNIRAIHPSLSTLSDLLEVHFSECRQLATLPDLGKLRKLKSLMLNNTQISNIPGQEMLKHLKYIRFGDGCMVLANVGGEKISGERSELTICFEVAKTDPTRGEPIAIPGFDALPASTKSILLDLFCLVYKVQRRIFEICLGLAAIHDRDPAEMMHILQLFYSQSILKLVDDNKSGVLSPEDLVRHWDEKGHFPREEAQRRPGWTTSRLVMSGGRVRAFEPGARHEGLRALVLSECKYLLKINLEGLTNLRYLCIRACDGVQEVSGWAELKNLAVLEWRRALWNPSLLNTKHLTSLRHLCIRDGDLGENSGLLLGRHWSTVSSRLSFSIDCIQLTSLTLHVIKYHEVLSELEESPNLMQLKHLQRLVILGAFQQIHSSLSGLTALRHLEMKVKVATELPCLSKLTKLQVLDLSKSHFESIPGLEMLVYLRELKCPSLRIAWLPDLNHLAYLDEIDVRYTRIRDKALVVCNHNRVKVRVNWDD